jgi:hypothetical protein
MRPDLKANFLGKNGKLGCQQCADTKRSAGVRDAGFPVPGVEPKLFERIGHLTFETRDPRLGFFPIPGNERPGQIDLARKMVVNARLANSDHIGNVKACDAVSTTT